MRGYVEEIIKALQAFPQCVKVNTEATNMSAKTPSGVKKSRSKKLRSEKEKPRSRRRQKLQAATYHAGWPTISLHEITHFDRSAISRYNAEFMNIANGI